MKRVLAVGGIAMLASSLPAAAVTAHDCPCFPPGEWTQVVLPADVAAMTPEAASAVPGGVLILGRTGTDGDLEATLLTLPGPGDAGTEATDFPVLPGVFPSFVAGGEASDDVLVGGNATAPSGSDSSPPFLQVSRDGGNTWTPVDVDGMGLDVIIDGARHGDDFVLSGAVDRDGGPRPAVTVWDGDAFSPVEQLAGAQGFAIAVTSGPGLDTLTVGGITFNDKDKARPAVFSIDADGVDRSNLPGDRDDFPIDILATTNDVLVTTNRGRLLRSMDPSGKWDSLKDLKGYRVLPLSEASGAPLLAFGPGGSAFSFDDGMTWANSRLDGIADAGTVKATGITQDGGFWAFSRGPDDLARLHLTDGPGGQDPPQMALDPLDEFARMMARNFVDDLIVAAAGAPAPEFVDDVTEAMHEAHADRADGQVESDAPEGSPRHIAEGFLDRLEATGGSVPDAAFIFRATAAIQAEYAARAEAAGSTE